MRLISVDADMLAIGEPLPWTLYDQAQKVLMKTGQVIESEQQLDLLLASRPMREVSWQPPGESRESESSEDGNKALDALPSGGENRFTFADMRLRVGDRIQLQPPASVGSERYMVRLLGYLENHSLMVTAPVFNSVRVPLQEHDKIVARIFSSQKAFGFDCSVVRVCKLPYAYVHLSFPQVIQGAVVRKSPRVRTKIIATVSHGGATEQAEKLSGVIVDLSADGALVKSRRQLGDKSQVIVLSFRVTLHDTDALLTTRAIIRNVFTDEENKDQANALKFSHGLQFQDLQPNDRMILQSLIYQQMIEQPHTLA